MYKWLLCIRFSTTRYIGLVSIVSVLLGVATMIVVNSVMGGFREKMRDRLLGILSDVIVESTTTDGFRDPERVMATIQNVAGDKIAAMTPAVEVFAMLHFQNNMMGKHYGRPVVLMGIDPKGRAKIGDYARHLMNPSNQADPSFEMRDDAKLWRQESADLLPQDVKGDPAGCHIGYQIATIREKLMHSDEYVIRPGHEIIITTVTAGKPQPTDDRLVVVDTYKSDMSEYDSKYVFMPIAQLQRIRKMGNAATSIQIKLKDYADAKAVVAAIKEVLPRIHFDVVTWEDKQGPLLQAVKIEAFILNVILFFIIAVAGFGILAIFFMIVTEKTRDIGILKALGASDRGVMSVFLSFGLLLGLVGCFLGSAFGVSFTHYINPFEQLMTRWTGWELFPRDIYYFKEIPVLIDWMTVFWINAGALFIAVSASVLPARRAARLRPVQALRYE